MSSLSTSASGRVGSSQILDVLKLLQSIQQSLLHKMTHDHAARSAEPVHRELESFVQPDIDLYFSHLAASDIGIGASDSSICYTSGESFGPCGSLIRVPYSSSNPWLLKRRVRQPNGTQRARLAIAQAGFEAVVG